MPVARWTPNPNWPPARAAGLCRRADGVGRKEWPTPSSAQIAVHLTVLKVVSLQPSPPLAWSEPSLRHLGTGLTALGGTPPGILYRYQKKRVTEFDGCKLLKRKEGATRACWKTGAQRQT